ncbi:MAG: pyridoxamine 5'-phosphate oxidase family protein [Deltaproteobacteria bacterium]|nr:pyridoxamine 5'-phosphate oxidase family protein [Deltaproteobacteria bacterium]
MTERADKLQQLHAIIRKLLLTQNFAVLATKAEPCPHTSLVAICPNRKLTAIYFCTSRRTRKFANFRASAAVSLLLDDRRNQAEDLNQAAVLSVTGRVRELRGETRTAAGREFLQRHPTLKDFCALPDTAICSIEVDGFHLIHNFQDIFSCFPGDLSQNLSQAKEPHPMDLKNYFSTTQGTGILATANGKGQVNTAIYSRPHVNADGSLSFILANRLTRSHLRENPEACYLFLENRPGYQGCRIYLRKKSEEQNPALVEEICKRCKLHGVDGEAKDLVVVHFEVGKTLPLIGDGELLDENFPN